METKKRIVAFRGLQRNLLEALQKQSEGVFPHKLKNQNSGPWMSLGALRKILKQSSPENKTKFESTPLSVVQEALEHLEKKGLLERVTKTVGNNGKDPLWVIYVSNKPFPKAKKNTLVKLDIPPFIPDHLTTELPIPTIVSTVFSKGFYKQPVFDGSISLASLKSQLKSYGLSAEYLKFENPATGKLEQDSQNVIISKLVV